MQFSKLAFISALAAVASAQTSCSIADLPTCAVSPALQAIGSTGCSATNLACVCSNQAFIAQLTPAIQSGCSPADYQTAVTVAACLCAQAGVTLAVPGSTTSAVSSAAPVTTTTSVAVVTTTTSVAVTTVTSSTAIVSTTASASSTVSKNATVTTSGPIQVTANAAAGHGSFVAAGLLGVGALLAAL